MKNFTFHNPTKLIFGDDSMDKIAENVMAYGKKVLIVYGKGSIKKNGIYEKVTKNLANFKLYEFAGIEPNPKVETIRKCLKEFNNNKPEFILAIGGGSVIDATKLLSCSFYYNGDPWDFLINQNLQPTKYIPFGAVLTISATGSEMNSGSVITSDALKIKTHFNNKNAYPKFSIVDPRNQFSLSNIQTAYGIADAFSHVLEIYLNNSNNVPLQDKFSESVMLTLLENAPKVLKKPNDYESRSNIVLSATMALNGILRLGTTEDWACHRIEHEFSAFYDIPHGAGLAIITPSWMKEVYKTKLSKFEQYGIMVWKLKGSKEKIAKESIKNTYKFFKSIGIKMKLSDWQIDKSKFEIISERLENKIGEFPLSKKQILNIINDCL